jgi:hypothetical protein
MPKRKTSRAAPESSRSNPLDLLRTALAKETKADLTELLLELARDDGAILHKLSQRFVTPKTPDDIVAATRLAISDATAFDVRRINRNFHYDHAAYATVKRNFGRMIETGNLPAAMELALQLMKRGSHQVEMSDEGLMTYELEECLNVVIDAVRRSDLPTRDVTGWCESMLKADRVQFIACDKLESLSQQP